MNELPSIWQLRVFDCVARLENVTKASHELLRTQPAITICINSLEKILGITLFERSKTGIYLSEAGAAAHIRTKRIIDSIESAMQLIPGEQKIGRMAIASRITRSQSQALVAIHECHSFRAAAARLEITDASLQRSARTLEANIGCDLYRNTAAGIKTTELGDALAMRLRHIAAQATALVEAMKGFNYPRSKSINIGVMLLDPAMLIVNAIQEIHEKYPDVRVAVINGTYDSLVNKLLREEIDFIVGLLKHRQSEMGLVREVLYSEAYCIVARRGHPLSLKSRITVEDLLNYQWILPPASSPRRRAYEHVFAETTPPPALIETYSLSTIRISLAGSDMLTVLSWVEILSERHFGLLAPLPFDVDCEEPAAGITMAKGKQLTDVQQHFVDVFRKNAACLLKN